MKIWKQVKKLVPELSASAPQEAPKWIGPGETAPAREVSHREKPSELGHRLRVLCQTFHPGLPVTEVWRAISGYVAAEGKGIDEKFGPGGVSYEIDTTLWSELVEGRGGSVVSERLLTAISIALGGGDYLISDDPVAVDRMEAIFEFIQSQNVQGTRTLLFSSLDPGAPAHAYRDAAAQVKTLKRWQDV